jgi:lipoprotein-anchoring transpeptidase ErfK/SrfK
VPTTDRASSTVEPVENRDRDEQMRRWFVALVVVAVVAVASNRLGRHLDESAALPPPSSTGTSLGAASSSAITSTEPPPPPASSAETTSSSVRRGPRPPRFPTTVAVAVNPAVAVHDAPGGRQISVLHSPAPYSGMPQVFMVLDGTPAPPGWLHVALRTRPNDATGWIRRDDVVLDSHTWSIAIDLTERWATVYDGPHVFASTPVVIGTAASPTPDGDFFIVEAVWTGSPGGAYGPFIYGLSAHSEVYTEFAGGDGQIGLHGTNQPGLLGTAASHGCVRFPNDVMLRMANALPMGVPVHIHH